ncbi:MAG: DUF4982 domain-containing protein [Bacteroidales bacterium]|nr:DUF4982 domain-containing protein [Bacteroidales bacterium]MBN2820442.1 DUF4982 domain-containing protein [Bacteroidales bacterium]
MLKKFFSVVLVTSLVFSSCTKENIKEVRVKTKLTYEWFFTLTDSEEYASAEFDHSTWRKLDLPHDWSIEGEFSENNPATAGGGALPGGIGWYRKEFFIPESDSSKMFYIDFDGVYWNSEVYLNGILLGKCPNGYISFRYNLTPYLNYGEKANVIAVRVNNSNQPNSRWYSGSGIYRNVWLVKTNKIHVDQWGTYITTPEVSENSALVKIETKVRNNTSGNQLLVIETVIRDQKGKQVASISSTLEIALNSSNGIAQELKLENPALWNIEKPVLYTAESKIIIGDKLFDNYTTRFGIRHFEFDAEKGFILNGEQTKILGVCNHHDLGSLGSAVNRRAIERQLEILKGMGCNGVRTSHNPPAPELLDLCDEMGFIVMDETFDMWKKNKSPYDYAKYWDEWHETDLRDHILRDRNHPSVFIWSFGNEILEQWDTSGIRMAPELASIIHSLDTTRPLTLGCNPPSPTNNLIIPGVVDLIGYNYAQNEYEKHREVFPGMPFIATETVSGLMTRGHYDMPSDSIRRWPIRWDLPFTTGNPDNTVSAYDNVSAPWGSTHEETWKIMKKHDYLSGMFIWTGFDYIGEPTPYGWPSKSSYFGIIDLAGFPKDIYFMYKSEWTDEPVLHIFPHWNWTEGQEIDIIAYTNCDEVELFLNDSSLGKKTKGEDDLKLVWRTTFIPGTIKAIGHLSDGTTLEKITQTAGEAAKIMLTADRSIINADSDDLSFITVDILDNENIFVPLADNMVNFTVTGPARIVGVDNGNQTSHEPFKANYRKAFNGKCLVILKSTGEAGRVTLTATSESLKSQTITINTTL